MKLRAIIILSIFILMLVTIGAIVNVETISKENSSKYAMIVPVKLPPVPKP
jgi:hypothetical protein